MIQLAGETMPRLRKIQCNEGLVHFEPGITEDYVQTFLKANKIDRMPNTPKWMATIEHITIAVPPAETYIVPDEVYVWVKTELCR